MTNKSDFVVIDANSAFYDYNCCIRCLTKEDIWSLINGKLIYTTVDRGKIRIALKLENEPQEKEEK